MYQSWSITQETDLSFPQQCTVIENIFITHLYFHSKYTHFAEHMAKQVLQNYLAQNITQSFKTVLCFVPEENHNGTVCFLSTGNMYVAYCNHRNISSGSTELKNNLWQFCLTFTRTQNTKENERS